MSVTNQIQTLLGIGGRSFGAPGQVFSGYVTMTENTVDKLTITKQPVQQGATISDHAFKEPTEISIQIIFGSNLFNASLTKTYASLLALQSSLIPFTVSTPTRVYPSMLFAALAKTTAKNSENILAINATFQQVIIVPLLVGNIDPSLLKNPGSNSATQPVGQKQATSALATLFGGSTASQLPP